MKRWLLSAVVTIACLLVGCPGPIVETTTPTPRARFQPRTGTTLLVAPWTVSGSSGVDEWRLSAMDRRMLELLGEDGTRAMRERDVGGPPAPGTFLLRLGVEQWTEDFHYAPEIVICSIFGAVTLGLGILPCANTRHAIDHTIRIEARLFDVWGAEVVRVSRADRGEIELQVDTAERMPLVRRTYDIRVRTGIGHGPAPSSGELEIFERELGKRVAELVYQEMARELAEAIESAGVVVPQQIQSIQAATSGGEAPVLGGP